MPVTIIYQDNPSGVIGVFTGAVTGKDIIAFSDTILARDDLTYKITDFRSATYISVSLPELHRIAIQDCSMPDTYQLRRLAIVGDSGRYAWLVEIYRVFTEMWLRKRRRFETRIFDDIDEAYQWIGIDTESEKPDR